MKHTLKITLILLLIFFLAQLCGLAILSQYIDVKASAESGKTVLHQETYNITGLQPPEVEHESWSFFYIIIAVLIGTALILLIIKFKKRFLWKMWFFLSVFICLLIAFSPFVYMVLLSLKEQLAAFSYPAAFLLAVIFAWLKTWKNNVFVHNFTELFIYGGLAAIVVPILNMFSVVIILLVIAVYDIYAVWKSKHMVKMAKFQTKEKLFAGLYVPYKLPKGMKIKPEPGKSKKKEVKSALLGGGDIAFPLLFSGVLLKTTGVFMAAFITTIAATAALAFLFYYSQKHKFYPAMPFIAAGLFIGYGIVMLIL